MHLQKKHKINYLGLSVFIVLCLLFTFAFYEIITRSPDRVFHYELTSASSSAIVLNKIQQPSLNKPWLPQFDNSSFKVITVRIKLLTNNRLIHQRISSFQEVELSVLHINPPGFYYHYHLRDTEDLPLLS
jgi:hypothetical protein